MVVLQRNPIYSAFALIVTLCSLSVIYGLLGSPFIAVLQIVVYAGAIMVLFLFVIMLLNVKREDHAAHGPHPHQGRGRRPRPPFSSLQVGSVLVRAGPAPACPRPTTPPRRTMAELLFSVRFLYVFEATSILILAALVGADRPRQEGRCREPRPPSSSPRSS